MPTTLSPTSTQVPTNPPTEHKVVNVDSYSKLTNAIGSNVIISVSQGFVFPATITISGETGLRIESSNRNSAVEFDGNGQRQLFSIVNTEMTLRYVRVLRVRVRVRVRDPLHRQT